MTLEQLVGKYVKRTLARLERVISDPDEYATARKCVLDGFNDLRRAKEASKSCTGDCDTCAGDDTCG